MLVFVAVIFHYEISFRVYPVPSCKTLCLTDVLFIADYGMMVQIGE